MSATAGDDAAAARTATPDDLDRIVDLAEAGRAELIAQRGGLLWALREARPQPLAVGVADDIAAPRSLVVAGTYAGIVVGYATVTVEDLRDGTALAVLSDVFVHPAARGVGVGEAMMDLVLAWCDAQECRGIEAIALPGMRETKNFFESFGLKARQLVVHRPLGRWAAAPDASDQS
jgi:GNAT superfamily N-acetyltransferase